MNYTFIKNDMFNIDKRLKKIDKNYQLCFNHNKNRFEVLYKNGLNLSTEIVFDEKFLSCKIIDRVLESRVENIKKIIEQMEKNNERMERDEHKKLVEELTEKVERLEEVL